jgi:hypothetical protein
MDMYDGSESDAAPDTAQSSGADEAEKVDNQDEESGEQSALVSNDFFGGTVPPVGSTCTVKIVKGYDGETEIQYVGSEEDDAPKKSSMMDEAMSAMDKYGK